VPIEIHTVGHFLLPPPRRLRAAQFTRIAIRDDGNAQYFFSRRHDPAAGRSEICFSVRFQKTCASGANGKFAVQHLVLGLIEGLFLRPGRTAMPAPRAGLGNDGGTPPRSGTAYPRFVASFTRPSTVAR
jgi:hypothetical protein